MLYMCIFGSSRITWWVVYKSGKLAEFLVSVLIPNKILTFQQLNILILYFDLTTYKIRERFKRFMYLMRIEWQSFGIQWFAMQNLWNEKLRTLFMRHQRIYSKQYRSFQYRSFLRTYWNINDIAYPGSPGQRLFAYVLFHIRIFPGCECLSNQSTIANSRPFFKALCMCKYIFYFWLIVTDIFYKLFIFAINRLHWNKQSNTWFFQHLLGNIKNKQLNAPKMCYWRM